MYFERILIVLGLVSAPSVLAVWSCSQDSDCSILSGSVCSDGDCVCAVGQQAVLGGTVCADLAPYHTSTCVEDHQCSRMFTSFECQWGEESDTGSCHCQPGFHYFLGRCWRTSDYGTACTRDEECMSVLRNPFSMSCEGTCRCAEGFYERQRGECRQIGHAVGDGCVLNQDCQFPGGACDISTLLCVSDNNPGAAQTLSKNTTITSTASKTAVRQHFAACSTTAPCAEPFECSIFGACLCPIGYYANDDGDLCIAELGSPATSEEQCTGFMAVVHDGICTCMSNFFFDVNMRDCIRASRRITDSCVTDSNCLTFGAASRCGPPQLPWGMRNCECVLEQAVWDADREMCRLFAGIGEACEVDSDCLAGELEIHCVVDDAGYGTCTCPEGYVAQDGLCLTTGLDLGDACQATVECTETENTVCEDGRCSCDTNSYQELDGFCAPIIGGVCAIDEDCVIEYTVCASSDDGLTCQCGGQFVEHDESCWPVVSDIEAECVVDAQCEHILGDTAACVEGHCACIEHYHYRDGGCWPITGLFEGCSRSSQCYLSELTDRVVCRNSLCQCDFAFPYSEELNTCIIGGVCAIDEDCVIEYTVCASSDDGLTCQCGGQFVEHDESCWPVVSDIEAECVVDAQCEHILGDTAACVEGHCACIEHYHYRDGGCWPITGLFEGCSRSSQCYLSELTDRVVCRNSLCQCDFAFPYSEELNTCTDSSSAIASSAFVITASLLYLYLS